MRHACLPPPATLSMQRQQQQRRCEDADRIMRPYLYTIPQLCRSRGDPEVEAKEADVWDHVPQGSLPAPPVAAAAAAAPVVLGGLGEVGASAEAVV